VKLQGVNDCIFSQIGNLSPALTARPRCIVVPTLGDRLRESRAHLPETAKPLAAAVPKLACLIVALYLAV
jgi:hypothetical protein